MMPWHVEKRHGRFAVVSDSGRVAGVHPSREKALAQVRALYANVEEARR